MTEIKPPTHYGAFEVLLGNQRSVAGTREPSNQDATRPAEIAPSQQPFAVLFGCSDSRGAGDPERAGGARRTRAARPYLITPLADER